MSMRIKFCGCLEGSVIVRKGETSKDAIERAEGFLNDVMRKYAKSLESPIIGLDYGEIGEPESTKI